MKNDPVIIAISLVVGGAITIFFTAMLLLAYSNGQHSVWKQAVRAGVAIQVDGQFEFKGGAK